MVTERSRVRIRFPIGHCLRARCLVLEPTNGIVLTHPHDPVVIAADRLIALNL